MSLAALVSALALAQTAAPLDVGTLVVRIDTQEVARETFRLLTRRLGDNTSGWVLATTARWVVGPRPAVLAPVLELAPDSEPAVLVYEVAANGVSLRIIGQRGLGRYTLRYVSPGRERARELAAAPPTVMVDDSVFAPYLFAAWRAGATPTAVTGIFPRVALRVPLTIIDLGLAGTTLNRDSTTLRHMLVTGGPDGPVHVWLGTDGRLMKIEVPERSIRAERLPG
ncbi:MAG: hypothetical protein ACREMF_00660 [Gemmatimonadales bacterium]